MSDGRINASMAQRTLPCPVRPIPPSSNTARRPGPSGWGSLSRPQARMAVRREVRPQAARGPVDCPIGSRSALTARLTYRSSTANGSGTQPWNGPSVGWAQGRVISRLAGEH